MTTMLLGSQQQAVKCGIAVSPVTDWLYYSEYNTLWCFQLKSFTMKHLFTDSVFTERILGLPAENYKVYVEADATQRARNIPSDSFFLIHGLADLSAPYLHGIQLARSLTESNILFKHQVSDCSTCFFLSDSYSCFFQPRRTPMKVTTYTAFWSTCIDPWSTISKVVSHSTGMMKELQISDKTKSKSYATQ